MRDMKLEALQSLSVTVMIIGLFLSALGGFGAYFFSGGSERAGRAPISERVEPSKSDRPEIADAEDPKLSSIVEPVPEVTAKQLSLIPDSKLPAPPPPATTKPPPVVPATPPPAVAEAKPAVSVKPPAPKPATPAPEPPKVVAAVAQEPSPVIPKTAPPETHPPSAVAGRSAGLGIEPWQKDKLLQRLRSVPNGSIAIQVPEGNADALDFATALKESFLAAGWHVTGLTAVKTDREPHGLTLSSGTFPPPTEVTTIFSALVSAGIKLSTDLDPSQGKQHAILFVGSRP